MKIDASSLSIAGADSIQADVTRLGKESGLPGKRVSTARAGGEILFSTQNGLKRFEEKQGMFVPDSSLGAQFADPSFAIFLIQEDERGNVWVMGLILK